MGRAQQVTQTVKATEFFDARGETDTLRLWENYRDQALMWRALAMLQIPSTLLLILFSVFLWVTRTIILNVPAKPLPGTYLAKEIDDTEFYEYATNFINLVATYQPATARKQFMEARERLKDPMLERFDLEMINVELKAIENTNRTQIFFSDPTKQSIERIGDREVLVTFVGDRLKLVAGKELPTKKTKFTITMTTLPRNNLNPYGIVITNATYEDISLAAE